MQPKIFIDLEDTIVEPIDNGWPQSILMDVTRLAKVAKIIKESGNTQIGVFSFAIATAFDRRAFNSFLLDRVERALSVKINDVLTHQDMLTLAGFDGEGNFIDQLATVNKLGKRLLFIGMCRELDGEDFVLIDDTTADELVNANGKRIRFVDATKL